MNKKMPRFTIISENQAVKDSLKKMIMEAALRSEINIRFRLYRTTELVILDLHSRNSVKQFGDTIEKSKGAEIPFTIILGIEQSLEDYDRLFLKGLDDLLAPIRLLTHVCGRKYCRYFSLLDEKSRLIAFLKKIINDRTNDDKESLKLKNPFKKISEVKDLLPRGADSTNFLLEAGKFAVPEHRKRMRLREFHVKEGLDSLTSLQFYDLAAACVKHNSQIKDLDEKKKGFNVLLIENNPHGDIEELKHLSEKKIDLKYCLKKIETLFHGYKFWIYPKEADYQFLKDRLNCILDDEACREECEREILAKVELIEGAANPNQRNANVFFKHIDLILIDIYLGEGTALSGLDFLKLFTLLYPEIPAFILSVSEDTEVIGKAIEQKADYYILKKNIFSLPYLYHDYIDDLGKLISHIDDRELRRSLIGNVRYWRFKKELLWFGDKCYHMINHSYNHAENDWRIANQILPAILDLDYLMDEETSLSSEDIYSFCMAVWLHDIGHKGNEHYGEPHEIRDLHGLISAEIFMKKPESYGIFGYKGSKVSPYRWETFGHLKTAPQLIRERLATFEASGHFLKNEEKDKEKELRSYINKLTILEKIALISIYHKSNFPLDEDDLRKFQQKGKRIPQDCYYDKNRETSPIHLKSISDLLNSQNLLRLTTLFRFVDGLDINQNRVGDNTEESAKKFTNARDISYQQLKLKEEVDRIRDSHIKDTGMGRRFFTLFYERIIDDIQKNQYISMDLKKEQRQFLDTIGMDLPLNNYDMLAEYIEFISVQDGHFGLHNSIEAVEIEVLPPHDDSKSRPRFRIRYVSRRKEEYLDKKDQVEVKVRGQKEGRTIRDHLLGERERGKDGKEYRKKDGVGYVRRELNDGKKYLEEWFDLDHSKIRLKRRDDTDDPWEELPEEK